MKTHRRLFALMLTLVILVSTLAVPAAAAENDTMYGIGFVTASALRLRSEANTTSKILDTAPKNDCVVVIAKVGSWYKVNYNLQTGYMHQDYVSVLTRENAELGYGKVTGSAVNLRSGPSTAYRSVDLAAKGEKVYIIGLNQGWYKVIFGSSICYIRSDYVELTEIPYENKDSSNSPKFFRLGKSTGTAPSASALNGGSGLWETPSQPETSTPPDNSEGVGSPDLWGTPSDTPSADSGVGTPGVWDNGEEDKKEEQKPAPETPKEETPANPGSVTGQQILSKAQQYLGTPYVYGGASPSGFDCSGFVYYVLKSLGFSPYRTPADQYRSGTYVAKADLQVGDIVFFAGTYASGISHVGIYAGNGQFIHSPNSRSVVSYSDLSSGYWANHYYGARRMA